jgi:putative hydrolase of the HAD superfamily
MTGQPRAVLFDLDDTLYRERRFALSGFREVALVLSASGVDPARAFALLVGCLRRGERATALQTLCHDLGGSDKSVAPLVEVIRGHMPRLTLPQPSLRALEQLHGEWKLGIVTNGFPGVQRRKVTSLGLWDLVDTVVFAYEHGSGLGKPDAEPFRIAASRLGVEPARCVFVGDDLQRDIAGARALGMRTIRIARPSQQPAIDDDLEADRVTAAIEDVVHLAPELLRETSSRCA